MYNLQRFITAQEKMYPIALAEIRNGKKQSHWMWYIFPQLQGLGFSPTSIMYAIKNMDEAKEFINHPVLGKRLVEISNELLQLESNDAHAIFGTPDNVKLQSCMTLFSLVHHADAVFPSVLAKFFNGIQDVKTIQIIGKQ